MTGTPVIVCFKTCKISVVGHVHTNRCGVLDEIKAKGEIVSKIISMNKRPVVMLTIVHDDSVVTKWRRTRGGVEKVHCGQAVQ